ncbi:uncharacterized protein LOC111051041 [Nilaparvata lugens]|uniref:uncharacterized protein LOC111051041 n=1 Tax=Nilaparvata lugens TaxID=108931 RepID=UPI00193CD3E5|nr:uncharacterized protein LOC111051041 [Nilaparvata lugens]
MEMDESIPYPENIKPQVYKNTLTPRRIQNAQREDPKLSQILEILEEGPSEPPNYLRQYTRYRGFLFHRTTPQVRYAAAPYEYLAEEFYLGMNADIHNKNAHRYQLIARSEINLKDIIDAYKSRFGKEPQESITNIWTQGEYSDLFLAVLNGNP